MGVSFDTATLLGPLGLVAFLLLAFATLLPWVKALIASSSAVQSARIDALEVELKHCRAQHESTTSQLIALASENGYLRGRIEALEEK